MPAIALFLIGGAKSLFGSVVGWLSRLSFAQVALLVLALFAGLQTIRVSAEKRHSAKLQTQIEKVSAELKRISAAKNEQKIITRDRIVIAERKAKDADGVAKKIEAAPLPGQCRSPSEVLQADL